MTDSDHSEHLAALRSLTAVNGPIDAEAPTATHQREQNYRRGRPTASRARLHKQISNGTIGVNSIQRRYLGVSENESVDAAVFSAGSMDSVGLAALTFSVDYILKNKARGDAKVDAEELTKAIVSRFQLQFFTMGQQLVLDYRGDEFDVPELNEDFRMLSFKGCV